MSRQASLLLFADYNLTASVSRIHAIRERFANTVRVRANSSPYKVKSPEGDDVKNRRDARCHLLIATCFGCSAKFWRPWDRLLDIPFSEAVLHSCQCLQENYVIRELHAPAQPSVGAFRNFASTTAGITIAHLAHLSHLNLGARRKLAEPHASHQQPRCRRTGARCLPEMRHDEHM